jgi:sugar phosphate isomerase/epimerase
MSRIYSLAYLTSAPLGPVAALTLAAKLGYQAIGIRIAAAMPRGDYSPLIEQPELVRDTLACMRATGVAVFDVEIVRIGADFKVADLLPFLDVCGRLDAKAVLVAGDDPDEARLTASYAAFCGAAADRNLTADIEFMPWTKIPDCKTALRIVTAARQPNSGILVDALHAARSTTTFADIAALPRALLHYGQMCDAPAEVPTTLDGLLHTARQARLIPGEGGIDLERMFAGLPSDLPISLEIPHAVMTAQLGVEDWSRRALAGARAVLAGHA